LILDNFYILEIIFFNYQYLLMIFLNLIFVSILVLEGYSFSTFM
jgi:hypothetical protein